MALFSGCTFCFLYNDHVTRLKKNIEALGGVNESDFELSEKTRYAVVHPKRKEEEILKQLSEKGIEVDDAKCTFVRSSWIVTCVKSSKIIPCGKFLVASRKVEEEKPLKHQQPGSGTPAESEPQERSGDAKVFVESKEEEGRSGAEQDDEVDATLRKLRNFWMNFRDVSESQSSKVSVSSSQELSGLECEERQTNQLVVNHLKELAEQYKSSDMRSAKFFRIRALKHAIRILSGKPYGFLPSSKQIRSAEEILQVKHGGQLEGGVGRETAGKVDEILREGGLLRLKMLKTDEFDTIISSFTRIWGVGIKTARKWYQRGHRTIEDIETKVSGLTEMQKIGIKYYNLLQGGVSRELMESALAKVRAALGRLSPAEELDVHLAGSYRRGKASTHDVDLLVFSENPELQEVVPKIVLELRKDDFILESFQNEGHSKDRETVKSCMIMAICKFTNGQIGRADIKLYHKSSSAFAFLHCTGSAEFNRAMRFWPLKNRPEMKEMLMEVAPAGMIRSYLTRKKSLADIQKEVHKDVAHEPANSLKLTDTALIPVYREVRGNKLMRNIIWEAIPEDCIKCDTEADVFSALGLAFVPPHLRKM